jgi:hypothetical protein
MKKPHLLIVLVTAFVAGAVIAALTPIPADAAYRTSFTPGTKITTKRISINTCCGNPIPLPALTHIYVYVSATWGKAGKLKYPDTVVQAWTDDGTRARLIGDRSEVITVHRTALALNRTGEIWNVVAEERECISYYVDICPYIGKYHVSIHICSPLCGQTSKPQFSRYYWIDNATFSKHWKFGKEWKLVTI